MEAHIQSETLKRLSYIEGHLLGVQKMIAEDRYCTDILRRTRAARRALERMDAAILEGYLKTQVVTGITAGKRDQIVGELMELYDIVAKYNIGVR